MPIICKLYKNKQQIDSLHAFAELRAALNSESLALKIKLKNKSILSEFNNNLTF